MTERTDLQKEIDSLMKQQLEALKQATYLTMTLEESDSFDERANLVAKLRCQLMKLEGAA